MGKLESIKDNWLAYAFWGGLLAAMVGMIAIFAVLPPK